MRKLKYLLSLKIELELNKKIFGYSKVYYDGWNYSITIFFIRIFFYE